jgi:hypothetical protein
VSLAARRMATAMGMAECTPKGLTSYEAASATHAAHAHGLASQLGRIALFHRSEERIHVQVDDRGERHAKKR